MVEKREGDMTNDEMNVAIAEACGWIRRPDLDYVCLDLNSKRDVTRSLYAKDGVLRCVEDMPNYPNDLNAMHLAIMDQSYEFRLSFDKALRDAAATLGILICELDATVFATTFLKVKRGSIN